MRSLAVALLATAVLLGGCSDNDTTVASDTSTGDSDARYTASGTVLESPDHGPELCANVAESYPPQCSGAEIIGWDWAAVEGAESANGTTWGNYSIVGTWDGEALTLTEPPTTPDPSDHEAGDDVLLTTPCPEPAGGWQVIDEATASDEAMNDAVAHARLQPDVGGVWVDQSTNPATNEDPINEWALNDPKKLVLNLSFTGDLERHEAEVREIWGGAVCVSEAPNSISRLMEIQSEIQSVIGVESGHFLSSGIDESEGRIEVHVLVADGLQERYDERYGSGVVEVRSFLQAVER